MRGRFRSVVVACAGGLLIAFVANAAEKERTAEAPYPFSRVLVVAASEDETMRREFEVAVVDAMHKGKSEGISSYVYGQEAAIKAVTKDTVVQLAGMAQVDAVLVIRGSMHDPHLGKTQDQTFIYIGPIASAVINDEGTMAAAVASNWAFHVVPGAVTVNGVIDFDTKLYLPSGDNALVYRSTRSFKFKLKPGERGQDVASLHAKDIVKALRKDGMIR